MKILKLQTKKFHNIGPYAQCYKTFDSRNLRIGRMSFHGRPRLMFLSNLLESNIFQMFHSKEDLAGTACHGQTLQPIAIVNYGRKKFYNFGPWLKKLDCGKHSSLLNREITDTDKKLLNSSCLSNALAYCAGALALPTKIGNLWLRNLIELIMR